MKMSDNICDVLLSRARGLAGLDGALEMKGFREILWKFCEIRIKYKMY